MPPQALGRAPQQPQQPQQLPPQMFTTAAQLLDLTDSTCIRVGVCAYVCPSGSPYASCLLASELSLPRDRVLTTGERRIQNGRQ